MDYGLINLMLRDQRYGEYDDWTVFEMYNTVVKFGKETEYEEIKVILRIFYKELKVSLHSRHKRIPGKITDERISEMVDIMEKLIHDYYFMNRFKD